jgi:hypothetical protein
LAARIFVYVLLLYITTSCSLVVPEQPRPAPALQFLYGPETSRKLIVFVHGVLGNSHTWDNASGKSWPELMKDDDAFRDYRIATYRYDSPLLGPTSTIQEAARRMLEQLDDNGIFRNYREVYFITHSMGGLVTKRAIVNLNNPQDIEKLRLYCTLRHQRKERPSRTLGHGSALTLSFAVCKAPTSTAISKTLRMTGQI